MEFKRRIPTLLDLCVQTAIDNLRYIGDVGETELELLKDILPHCTIDQLSHIEKSTGGRDLSPVTNDLWKRFYERQFGTESMNLVIKRMKQKKIAFKWRQLFEAKTMEREKAQERVSEKIKQRYAEEQAKKQSKQIQICSKVPPSSKRKFYEGFGSRPEVAHLKSNIMKKAKIETLKSHESRIHAAMKNNSAQTSMGVTRSANGSAKPGDFRGKVSVSNPKPVKPPLTRRL